MKRKEYEELRKIDLVVVKETIQRGLDIETGKEWDFWTYYIFFAYIIWKTKKNPDVDVIEYLSNLISSKGGTMMPIDDICFDFLAEKKNMQKVKKLASLMSEDELAAYVLFGATKEYDDPVPSGITALANSLLKVKKNSKYTMMYGSAANAMIDTYFCYPQSEYEIIDDDYVFVDIAILKSDVAGVDEIKGYVEPEEEYEFDKIFIPCLLEPTIKERAVRANYILETYFPEFPSRFTNYWNYIGEALYYSRNGGRVVSLVTGGALTGNYGKEVREYLISNGYVEKVIVLPEKMYQTTWINPFVIVLSQNNKKVTFVDARDCYNKDRLQGKRINILDEEEVNRLLVQKDDEKVSVISNEDILDNASNLSPLRYVTKKIEAECIKLGDCVLGIRRGAAVSGKDMDELYTEEETGYRCVLPLCINDGVIQKQYYFKGDSKAYGNAIAYPGEILVIRTGHPYKLAMVEKETMIAGNLYSIRIDKTKINPAYVKCYLESEMGQEELGRLSSGSKTPIISISNIMQVNVPIYPEEVQEEYVRKSEELIGELQDCYKKIADIKNELKEMFK